jgi:hypothetical protein
VARPKGRPTVLGHAPFPVPHFLKREGPDLKILLPQPLPPLFLFCDESTFVKMFNSMSEASGMLVSAPLTTTFTPVPSCTTNFYTLPIYYSIGGPLASQCFPSGWVSTSQYFSPGICPNGYTQACSSLSISGTDVETQATCCPRYFSRINSM